MKICLVNGEAVLDDDLIQVSVHTDDPQPPGSALAGENQIWDENAGHHHNVWSKDEWD